RVIIQQWRRWLSQLDASHAGFLSKLDHFKLIKINMQLQGEDRSRICFPLYYIVVARTRSKTSGLIEKVPPIRRDPLFDMFTRRYIFTRPKDLPRARVVWESTA
ncbi:hypothetical protein Taro_056555, partial [Colocasia esculenta]|nr:hypothetical protein [Colocasia esculenta]